ncbi:hypothetical protein K458DRAFT_407802 [Lentithecium fluviatile CBS 122367]|uniref:Uncharacterized protein n=1 Tax=Lentithecium fluviatile CBS 122367 TaxID=1168545 RepID=A0A6G1ING2_9PLEO|nr:hypothetical protein K458DRAFT_407802 [Lentithecium fluviatile CBS 122367]
MEPLLFKLRNPPEAAMPFAPDTIFHLKLVWEVYSSTYYLGPFVEIEAVQRRVLEAVEDIDTIVPKGTWLVYLLQGPRRGPGLASVEDVRIPLRGSERSLVFTIEMGWNEYVGLGVREGLWSPKKLLYVVVIETPHFEPDCAAGKTAKANGKTDSLKRYVKSVEVKATFASLDAAKECVARIVEKWIRTKEAPGRVVVEKDDDNLMGITRGVGYVGEEGGMHEARRVRIITQELAAAEATQGFW